MPCSVVPFRLPLNLGKRMRKLMAILITAVSMACMAMNAAGHLPDEKITAARMLLERNGIETDIAINQFISYVNGGGLVSGNQVHEGLRVYDAQITYHFGEGDKAIRLPDGTVYKMGEFQDLSDLDFDRDALISEGAAIDAVDRKAAAVLNRADNDYQRSASHRVAKCASSKNGIEVELGILEQKPVWYVQCTKSRMPGAFVDAHDGSILELAADAPPVPMPIPSPRN